jgi:hypothetical protein
MDNCAIKGLMDGGGSSILWTTNGYEFGTASNFYIEDCTWSPYSSTSEIYHAGNGAFRYAFRYNKITIPTDCQIVPLFDQHGNQGQTGCFGAELYNNNISTSGNSWTTLFYDQRGGKSLVYNNAVTWTSSGGIVTRIREEHQDSEGDGLAINAINGQPQHISDSYYWRNTKNGAPMVPELSNEIGVPCNVCGLNVPTENVHVWLEKTSFDGTVGVGVGILSARPATCTVGVGYWASDQNKLYRCTSTNAWTVFYTPYAYPHPLRTDCVKYPAMCDSGSTPPPPPPPPTVPGDLNNDGKVDITDLVIVATNFGRTSGFDVRANVVSSIPEVIDISDLSFVARRFTG